MSARKCRTAAARLINNYVYESSGDEEEDQRVNREPTPQSSGDEEKDQGMDREPRPKNRFVQLKEALEKLEQSKAAKPVTKGTGKSLRRKVVETWSGSKGQYGSNPSRLSNDRLQEEQQASWVTMPQADADAATDYFMGPTRGFQKAMRDPSHPDFGLSFLAAVELAMAKDMKECTLGSTLEHWVEDDDAEAAVDDAAAGTSHHNTLESAAENAGETAADATTRKPGRQAAKKRNAPASASGQESNASNGQPPKKKLKLTTKPTAPAVSHPTSLQPQQPAAAPLPPPTQPAPLRIVRIIVPSTYDPVSFEAAVVMRDLGLSFGDLRVVRLFNRQMQEEDSSRPYKSQKSLLEVSKMTWEE